MTWITIHYHCYLKLNKTFVNFIQLVQLTDGSIQTTEACWSWWNPFPRWIQRQWLRQKLPFTLRYKLLLKEDN